MIGRIPFFFCCLCPFLFLTWSSKGHDSLGTSFTMVWSYADDEHRQIERLPEQFFVHQLTHAADCALEREELTYILGFDAPAQVSREQLRAGIERLGYKEKFDYITLYGNQTEQGWALHLVFNARWTFLKVRCKGSLLGKERYRHMYRIEPGQRFDAVRHHDSLVAIEQALHAQGYLEPDVNDFLVHDNNHKTVNVVLTLDPGKQYRMRGCEIVFDDTADRQSALALKLKQIYRDELFNALYAQGLVQQVERMLEEACAHEGFLQASVTHEYCPNHEQNTVSLEFHVTLGERRTFTFCGNSFFSEKQLLNRLLLFGKSVLMVPPSMLAQELIDLYKQKGFWNVAINGHEENNSCVFDIVEGHRARIADVAFEGVTYFGPEQVAAWCNTFKRTLFFDHQVQRQCKEEVMQAYVRAGFWDCRVHHADAQDLGDNKYRYHFVVQEGPQKLLKTVRIEVKEQPDNHAFDEILSQDPFVDYVKPTKPVPFDMYLVQEQRRALLAFVQKKGSLQAAIRPDLRYDAQGNVELVWIIEHATPITFGTTILAGESRLPTALIRRELLYEKGQVWDQKKVDRSGARLKNLGIFDTVTLQPVPGKPVPDKSVPLVQHDTERVSEQDLILTCIDDDPFEIRLRAGMQCIGQYFEFFDLGVCGGGSLVWKNPFNRADRIELNVEIAPHEDYAQVSYVVPRFFEWPLMTTASLYMSRFDQPLVNCFRERLYRLNQDGGSVEVAYSDNGAKWGCCVGFEAMKVYDISRVLADLIDFSPRLVGQRVPYFYLEPVVVKNYVDDLVNPTSGAISTITAKVMASFNKKAASFFKILLEQSFFVPLSKTWVGAVHLRAGHIFNSDFETIMPPERFYLGGAYSIRGYDADMAPPVNPALLPACCNCLLPFGGRTVLNGMFEVRFPLYKALGGVFFNDCGILIRKKWQDDCFVGATGFGLRYGTPLGPIRFDIAWKWRRQLGEEHRFAWFLTFGQAF